MATIPIEVADIVRTFILMTDRSHHYLNALSHLYEPEVREAMRNA